MFVCENKEIKTVRFNLGNVIVDPGGGLARSKSTDNLLRRKVNFCSQSVIYLFFVILPIAG